MKLNKIQLNTLMGSVKVSMNKINVSINSNDDDVLCGQSHEIKSV